MIVWNFLKECCNRVIQTAALYLGMPEAVFRKCVFDMFAVGLFVALLFWIGDYIWSGDKFVYIWLFCLTMWAFLHVRKSSTTWGRFDEIDSRDADFHDSVDKQIESLEKRTTKLEQSKDV